MRNAIVEVLCARFGWRFIEDGPLHELHEMRNGEPSRLLGWINPRPPYCDRGHWQVGVEIGGVDWADGKPAYFMRLSTAKQELVEFLAWRLHKVRAEQ